MIDNRETKPPPIPTAKEAIADIGADTAARLKRAKIAKKQAEAEQPQEPSDTTPIPTAKEVIEKVETVIQKAEDLQAEERQVESKKPESETPQADTQNAPDQETT